MLDTHLDLLDTDITTKHFVCLQNLLKTSSRHVFKTSGRRLQRKSFLSSKTSWKTKNCYAEDVLKTFSRHVSKTSLRRLEDQQMFAGYIVRTTTAHRSQIFRLLSGCVKIHQIPHVTFESTSQSFFKLCITLQCHET